MPKRSPPPIRTESFIPVGGKPVALDTLPEDERRLVGARLRVACLNGAFAGRAVFRLAGPQDGEKSPPGP